MKRLILLRHAKSGWDDPVTRDFDRPLNGKGKRAARAVGGWMRREHIAFDAALASPAARVDETIAHVGDGYGRTIAPVWDKRVYLASADTLLDLVHETDDGVAGLLLAGHNPGLEDLILLLTPANDEGPRGAVEEKLPTASLVEIAFEVDRWQEIAEGEGHIVRFIRPRDLDPELGPDQG